MKKYIETNYIKFKYNKAKYFKIVALALVFSAFTFAGCASLKQFANTIENLKRLDFKLGNVTNFALAGVNLQNKSSVSDLSIADAFKLTSAFSSRRLPAQFILNVEARNPNTTNDAEASNSPNASITNFEWRLILDDVPTISGNIAAPVTVPGQGETTTIPLTISIDLYEFFGNQGYDRIINLATALSGGSGSSRIKLDAKPTVRVGQFPITYPGRITIVDHEFRDK